MNEKQKNELIALVAEYGNAVLRGMDISSQLTMIEIQRRVKEIPEPSTDNPAT